MLVKMLLGCIFFNIPVSDVFWEEVSPNCPEIRVARSYFHAGGRWEGALQERCMLYSVKFQMWWHHTGQTSCWNIACHHSGVWTNSMVKLIYNLLHFSLKPELHCTMFPVWWRHFHVMSWCWRHFVGTLLLALGLASRRASKIGGSPVRTWRLALLSEINRKMGRQRTAAQIFPVTTSICAN